MHRRIPVKVDFRFEGDATGEGRLLEMSEGGLSFIASKEIAHGSVLRLSLRDEQGEIRLQGTVVHIRNVTGELVLGVKFDPLADPVLKSIQGLLKRHRFNLFRSPVSKTV